MCQSIETDEVQYKIGNFQLDFLQLHHCLNHCSFNKMQLMAWNGMLPSKFANCPIPLCNSCLYGKTMKKPWRHKGKKNKQEGTFTVTRPGQVVLVDQLESHVPGLVAQLQGWLTTTKRYKVATIFVDHHRLSYTQIQCTMTSEETIKVKEAFETYCQSMGVQLQHYHANNGIFNEEHKSLKTHIIKMY